MIGTDGRNLVMYRWDTGHSKWRPGEQKWECKGSSQI